MTRTLPTPDMIRRLTAFGPGSLDEAARARLLAEVREHAPELARELDHVLIGQMHRLAQALEEVGGNQEKLKQQLAKLTAPPWFTAVFVRLVEVEESFLALVSYGGQHRLVVVGDEVDPLDLEAGDLIFLNTDLNLLVGTLNDMQPPCGETAAYDRSLPDGRYVLKSHDAEVIVQPARTLRDVPLAPGDQVRWDKATWLAYEKIEKPQLRRYFLDEVPNVTSAQVGGQRTCLESLVAALTTTLVDAGKAQTYGLNGRKSVLMVGPPGCGKTLMSRVAAAEVSRLSGRKCRFAVAKPAEWEDPYVGVTQQNIRACFQALKEAAKDELAVLFLDEVESVGRIRGSSVNTHGDKFLAALLCELDGFTDRAGIAIIAATNRKDLIDPALLERLSDVEIHVQRPDMRGARSIFEIHLPETMPFYPNGKAAAETRQQVIETAVSKFYAPNAGNELCSIKFRDGKTRTVAAREIVSGRMFEQVCRSARQAAFLRDVRGGSAGISVADMEEAVSTTLQRLASTLTIRNVRSYLDDLPQDVDVVSVEPVVRRTARPSKLVND